MKRTFLGLALFTTATLLLAALTGFSQNQPWSQNVSPLPPPTGMVNDYAGVLDPATKQQLEQKLRTFKESTNPQVEIAVAIVKTTGERDIFDYSLAVARGWGIGSKEDDNPAALLFIAIDDRKYFTQISKDLEDELPDAVAGSLARQYLVPEFKRANYGKGVSDLLDAFITTIRNKGNAPVAQTTPTPNGGPGGAGIVGSGFNMFCCAIILLVVLLIIFGSRRKGPSKGDRDRWGGGPFGGSGGVSSALPWIVGGIISNIGNSSSSSGSSDWGGSSSGSDWGGFGGGGDFGGGGSGGDW